MDLNVLYLNGNGIGALNEGGRRRRRDEIVLLKIGILEDEPKQMQRITDFLEQFRQEHPPFSYTVDWYERGAHLLERYQRDCDLLFLDIQLPDMLGIEAAHRIREMDQNVMIIFVTNLTQYAIEGYSVRAFDYVLKPVSYAAFSAKLERALRILSHREQQVSIDIRCREGSRRLSSDMILYFEVFDHDLIIHTDQGDMKQWGSLSKYEKMLEGAHFARCNSCYLVNLKFVRGVERDTVVVGQDRLSISKSRRKAFLAALAQYKGGSN